MARTKKENRGKTLGCVAAMETDFGPGHIGTHVWKVEYVGKNLIVSELTLSA